MDAPRLFGMRLVSWPSSSGLCWTMRKLSTTSRPSIDSSSSGVFMRCMPSALIKVIDRRSMPASASSSSKTGINVLFGAGLVTSENTMATLSPGITRSCSGAQPIGLRKASRMAPAGSGRTGAFTGASTVA